MGVVDGITLYMLVWVLLFLFVPPGGLLWQHLSGERHQATASGAPAWWRRLLITGLIAAAIWAVIFALVSAFDLAEVMGGIAIYLIIWWLTFFAVLPWGVRSQHEHGERLQGTEPGAPVAPGLGRKVLITSLIAAVIWLAVIAAVWTWGPAVWDYYDRIAPGGPS